MKKDERIVRGTRRGSIRGKYTLLVAALVALTTAAMAATGFLVIRSVLKERMEKNLTLHARGVREVLRLHVGQQQERAALVASRTKLRSLLAQRIAGTLDEEGFVEPSRRILLDAQTSVADFLEITIADTDGVVLTSTNAARIGERVTDDAVFREGRDGATLGVPVMRDGRYEVPLSAPARADGELLGVVMIRLDAKSMRAALGTLTNRYETAQTRVAAPEGGSLRYLFPVSGRPHLATPSDDAVMNLAVSGSEGFVEETDGGRDVLAFHQPVGYRGWGLVDQIDADEAYAPIARLRWVAILTGLGVFVVAAFGARRLATRLTAPILDMAWAAERLADGNYSVRAMPSGDDELAQLAVAFNAMADSLRKHNADLEEMVRERTEELQVRTSELEQSRDQLQGFCHVLESQAEVIERDLERAEAIQRALLPQTVPPLPEFHVQTLYRPGRNIGGDLYDVVGLSDHEIAFVVADASGHGVSAALLSVLFKHRFRLIDERTGAPLAPGEALLRANADMTEAVAGPGMFVTAAYGLLDTESRELVVASAGHTPLIVVPGKGEPRLVRRTGPALGINRETTYGEERFTLEPGDRVLFYTDGLVETDGEDVSPIAIAEMLAATPLDVSDVLENIYRSLAGAASIADRDDVTMLLVQARPGENRLDSTAAAGEPAARAEAPPPRDGATVSWAQMPQVTFITVAGRAAWADAQSFLDAAAAVIARGDELVLDFSACTHQDSTFLGTVHEIVTRAAAAGTVLHVQGVPPQVRDLFVELSMDAVLARTSDRPIPLPDGFTPVPGSEEGIRARHLRLLRAHELLSTLSAANKRAFSTVIEALRADVPDEDV